MSDRDRWNKILEDLGLPPEGPPTAPPAAPVRAVAVKEEAPAPERSAPSPTAPAAAAEEESFAPRGRRRRPHPASEEVAEPIVSEESQLVEAPDLPDAGLSEPTPTNEEVVPIEEAGADEKGRRTRRRRRGSRSDESPTEEPSIAAGTTEAEAGEAAPSSETKTESSEERRGRRRRRGRKKGERDEARPVALAKDSLEDVVDEEPAPPVKTAARESADVDEMDDLSNWTGPSWNELIASLYRPDR